MSGAERQGVGDALCPCGGRRRGHPTDRVARAPRLDSWDSSGDRTALSMIVLPLSVGTCVFTVTS